MRGAAGMLAGLAVVMLAGLAVALMPAATSADFYTSAPQHRDWRPRAMALHRGPAADERARSAIVGGHTAKNGQFPWVVRVLARQGKVLDACSGTVVAADMVLTAAHCVEDVQSGALRRAGELEVQTGPQPEAAPASRTSRVSQVLVYPGFERQSGVGDAALLELAEPAAAPAVQLASEVEDWPAGTPAVMAGWGRAGGGRPTPAPYLRWADTIVQSPQWCTAKLRGFFTGRQLCAMDAPSDDTAGCAGDSGGPLLIRRDGETVEIGVLNGSVASGSSITPCLTTEPTVYASSSGIWSWVHDWILRTTSVPIAVSEAGP